VGRSSGADAVQLLVPVPDEIVATSGRCVSIASQRFFSASPMSLQL